MECGDYDRRCADMARGPSAVGLQLRFGGERGVPLAVASRVPRKPARPVVLEPPPDTRGASHVLPSDVPFMNDMDEISYWIHTKRAPCLMSLDTLIKKRNDEAQCSKIVNDEVPSLRKRKKKRKLSLLDDESVSTEKQHNVYFEVAQRPNQPTRAKSKSDSLGSDVEFNIKNQSFREKPKKGRLQKRSPAKIHKKTQAVTSTPKTTMHLRRSLRQAQQNNNNAHFNSSFELFNAVVSNGHIRNNVNSNLKSAGKVNKSTQMFAAGDHTTDNKRNSSQRNKSKNATHLNGQFEDLSDVSGFTANYIRSTKVQSSKTPRKLRCKSSRNLVKESLQSSQDDNIIVCVNKSMNTGVPNSNVLNCSTDSSQNVMNLVTSKNNDKSEKIDKSTSLLKFVETRVKSKGSNKVDNKQRSKGNLNVSFQSQSSGTSRYPKRYKHQADASNDHTEVNTRRRVANKNSMEFNNSDKKENPEETIVSRTRSGRNISLTIQHRENSVLVVSNSTEQVSSMVSMNVASPTLATQKKRKRRTSRQVRNKSANKSGHSWKDKSGFAACFSESDDDSVPLVQRKYFCN